jgi:hypothetical protein
MTIHIFVFCLNASFENMAIEFSKHYHYSRVSVEDLTGDQRTLISK